jgi:hypothetical protein
MARRRKPSMSSKSGTQARHPPKRNNYRLSDTQKQEFIVPAFVVLHHPSYLLALPSSLE